MSTHTYSGALISDLEKLADRHRRQPRRYCSAVFGGGPNPEVCQNEAMEGSDFCEEHHKEFMEE